MRQTHIIVNDVDGEVGRESYKPAALSRATALSKVDDKRVGHKLEHRVIDVG